MKNYIINFPSKGMAALWNAEFVGQFSDGYWENSRASRYGNGQRWWKVEASATKPTTVPDYYFPCPYSLNNFMTYLTREMKQSGDVWPYRLIAFYYAGEIGLRTYRTDLEIMVCIAQGGYHPFGRSIPQFLKKLSSKEKKFYSFLEQLDMKVEWRRLRQVVKQMNDIISVDKGFI